MRTLRLLAVLILVAPIAVRAADGNRLTYLDDNDLYCVGRTFPKLITPQWVGEEGVEAVVILGIDDMKDSKKYEDFLRPILNRLKKIDGRAPVSIMSCQVKPDDPQLQAWLKEGLSLETHTHDHPCPLLQGGDFAKAKGTYDKCVDALASVPNNRPVAFRMPCCDSLNTPSPRFYAEIFNKRTAKDNFLSIDTSVFNIFTANDPDLPRELVLDPDGTEKFRKYVPADRSFVNTIEDYPYPYVIGKLCWQFPCVTPSDWQAQFLHKPNNPITVRDWKAALDCTVIKQGVFCLVFHPHGWLKNEQVVDLIDHAVAKHGKKVKFITFKEAEERLTKNMLAGQPLRDPKTGAYNGVDLFDRDRDGYIDVRIRNKQMGVLRYWEPKTRTWKDRDLTKEGFLEDNPAAAGFRVVKQIRLGHSTDSLTTAYVVANDREQAVLVWSKGIPLGLQRAPFSLPPGAKLSDGTNDTGLRFVDLDEDGFDDVIFSNENGYGIYLFKDMKEGWSRKVIAGKPGDKNALPLISRNGQNMGFWVHSRHLWWQNENTNLLPNLVDRRSFNQLLEQVEPGAKSPAASLAGMKARPGFVVEEVVAEPLVMDPIAFAWGPDGKLWVVEMADYPLGIDGKGKPGGRIKYLESTKGDGKYDKMTLFLDNVPFPTNVMPWRKGVIVSAAPEIFYAEDTTGNGKADKKVPLFVGFREGNQQHRVNGLVWGLDNWVYCANGDSGGKVKSVKTGAVVDMSGRDVRIRPDTGEIDLQAGQTQYGRAQDDWGNWFGNNNSWPMWHFALADHYIRRNRHIAAPDGRVQISVTPGAAEVFPISRTMPRFNSPQAANHFTSACSCIVYRDDLFGPNYVNSTFVSEPVHNLVHREIMTANGTTFTSRRAVDEQRSEFLASSDNWCRPCSIGTGPDGALWVADMYRHVIEHPEWIPKDWQQKLDLRAGHDKGRIYRVYPVGTTPRAIPRLDNLDAAGLVAALDSPSGWQRDMAQMMLIWRNDRAAVPLLEKLAAGSDRPLARLHALCTLDGLDALRPEVVQRGLADAHPGVRRHAVRLSEGLLAKAPELGAALLKLLDDTDPQVRMQLAYTLGEWKDPRAGTALGQMAVQSTDRFLSAAVMSSVNRDNLDQVLLAVLTGKAKPQAGLVENLLRLASALEHQKALATLLDTVAKPDKDRGIGWQFTALAGLLDALDQRNLPLTKLNEGGDAELSAAIKRVATLFDTARATVADSKAARDDQLLAVRLLGRGLDRQAEDLAKLTDLLTPQTADDLQSAAVVALGKQRDAKVPALLLRGWKGYGPARRAQVLDVLLAREEWLQEVLGAIERKEVAAAEIDAVRRQRLLDHKVDSVRQRVAKLFAGAIAPDRQKVVDEYQPALKLAGDPARGLQVFTKNCANCHKLGDVGHVVGPDLASLGDKSPPFLLISILDPNRAVEARYVNYTALLKNGQSLSGIVANETGNSITLLAPEGKPQVILRTDLEELLSTGKSAMPDGLEKELKHQDIADVIAFVRTTGPVAKPKALEGNKPEVVRAGSDGSLRLTAVNAEIYGKTLVLEKKYANLGFWNSDDDHAVWSVEAAKAGRYAVHLDWACADGSAGKPFVLESGSNALQGKVAGTGGWDHYEQAKVGEIVLPAGPQRLTFKPGRGLASSALIDLRGIKLVPVE
ncbi:hypothetical protein AYO44_14035 [Planctomycetaceae bacterium SCGC AG-212-F19]|nr:hypothetical protein AYO44_14035 [Planctomycetaceae bacterium SCGC AG-212-F19]